MSASSPAGSQRPAGAASPTGAASPAWAARTTRSSQATGPARRPACAGPTRAAGRPAASGATRPPATEGSARTARAGGALGLALALALAAGPAAAECRQALALGLDVSGSVDSDEYALQLGGLAAALDSDEVRAILLELPELPVHLAVFEWSGPGSPRPLVGWTAIDGAEALKAVTGALRAAGRVPSDPSTAIGEAMLYGARLLAERPECPRWTLDLSGDGRSNATPRPARVREMAPLGRVTVNALAVGVDSPVHGDIRQAEIAALSAYFRAEVIHGPGAFVETALGYEDFEDAMQRKLLRELEGLSVSGRGDAGAAEGPVVRRR